MTRNNFICKITNELLDNKFSVHLNQVKMIEGCGGWFDSGKKEFMVALKNKMGFEILVHEYSHFLQWKNRKRYFTKLGKGNTLFFEWVGGKFFKKETVEEAMGDVIELEWDCETQALQLIDTFKLDIDKDLYCQAANAYLLYYHMVHETRTWEKKHSPYCKAIYKLMPTSLQPLDFYLNKDNISPAQEREYRKIIK